MYKLHYQTVSSIWLSNGRIFNVAIYHSVEYYS